MSVAYTREQLEHYTRMLQILGSFSSLYSDNTTPFLNSRIAENLYCLVFNANNLSRSDVSVDASIGKKGIGVKTFINKKKGFEKIAEFNKESANFRNLDSYEKIKKISELRNERIEATKRIYSLEETKYHCITREKNKIIVFETPLHPIDVKKIKITLENKSTIAFTDGIELYRFSISKSTLYKQFETKKPILEIPVKILNNPFEILERKFGKLSDAYYRVKIENPFVMLPLYSVKDNKKIVNERSALNQWNAEGRPRNPSEIYIQIPRWIHKRFPGFFPPRDQPFTLILPDGRTMNAKVCQDNSKALMSNPNLNLGKWLLRDVLDLKEGKVLTYQKLEEIGLDSVVVEKISNKKFKIDFCKTGTYEKFIERYG